MTQITIVETPRRKPKKFNRRSFGRATTKKRTTGQIGTNQRKEKSIAKLVKDLDVLVSRFVRLSAANKEGMVRCFTCDKLFHYKKIQNGHYISRFYKATRWDLDNCRPQCMWDNMFKNGDAANYRERLVKEIGHHRVNALELARHISQKLDRTWLENEIKEYTINKLPTLTQLHP